MDAGQQGKQQQLRQEFDPEAWSRSWKPAPWHTRMLSRARRARRWVAGRTGSDDLAQDR